MRNTVVFLTRKVAPFSSASTTAQQYYVSFTGATALSSVKRTWFKPACCIMLAGVSSVASQRHQ
jgi:hypothetical protein